MGNTKIHPLPMGQVAVTDKYCANAFNKEIAYLLSFDTDKLLAGFRETAGLDMRGAVRYSGWEDDLIGGHCVGHCMTAAAQAYASLQEGDDRKAALYKLAVTMTDGLKECQDALETGFIFGAKIIDKNNVEAQFDNVEKNLSNIMTQAWVPYYTLHKILAGAIDIYKLTGYENAKTVASRLGDWVYRRVSRWSEETQRTVLGIEYGGMNDCLYELYAVTGKEEHAIAAHCFDEVPLFENVYEGTENALNNKHANTTIPKFLGALKRYAILDGRTVDGETVDAGRYLGYAERFWDMVVQKHSYITGGTLDITVTGREVNDVSAKGVKIGWVTKEGSGDRAKVTGNAGKLVISGGIITVTSSYGEGLEVKGDLTFDGGETHVSSNSEDAINCQGDLTVNKGFVYAFSSGNDAMDSNGNTNLNGGYVMAICTRGNPEVAIDANTEDGKKLYINKGATVVAYGGLENGYSASQSVYSMSGTAGSWNALSDGKSFIAAFKAPANISSVIVSAPSLSSGYKGVNVSGEAKCGGVWAVAGITGGSAVSLSNYTGGAGGPGGGPGGGRP